MGASPTTRVHIVFPTDLLADVDDLAGPRERSRFVVEATRELVRRTRMLKALDEMAGSLVGVHTPPEWETPEGTDAWVCGLRKEWDDRLGHWLPEAEGHS